MSAEVFRSMSPQPFSIYVVDMDYGGLRYKQIKMKTGQTVPYPQRKRRQQKSSLGLICQGTGKGESLAGPVMQESTRSRVQGHILIQRC